MMSRLLHPFCPHGIARPTRSEPLNEGKKYSTYKINHAEFGKEGPSKVIFVQPVQVNIFFC